MMESRFLGWSIDQYAFAYRRYITQGNPPLAAELNGMVALVAWWQARRWPDPLSFLFVGVPVEKDMDWAAQCWGSTTLWWKCFSTAG